MKLLVTGGCGFIGSNFIRLVLSTRQDYHIVNMDSLTYAGNPNNLLDVKYHNQYEFVCESITNELVVDDLVKSVDAVVNFAAESHVDRSLHGPTSFIKTNILGASLLLEAAMKHKKRIVHISTDEVYGSIKEGMFNEKMPLHPNNPYSVTKASADMMAKVYFDTFKTDVVVTRSSNNYGPYQYPEKFIPLVISNALEDKPIPIYGSGDQIRDWLHVTDNCKGILSALELGHAGEIYNIGSHNEYTNLMIVTMILGLLNKPTSLMRFVEDRPNHDRRYAINFSKSTKDLGYNPSIKFLDGLPDTINWYKNNSTWVSEVKSNLELKKYYERQYGKAQ